MVLPHSGVRALLPQLLATTTAISAELGYAPPAPAEAPATA